MPASHDAAAGASPLPSQRHLFKLPGGVTYLSCASRSPMLRDVERIGHEAVSLKNEPWRITDDGIAERIRTLFAKLIGSSAGNVALTPSTSYAISMIAHNIWRNGMIKARDVVLILQNQMSSNVYPWQRLCRETGAELQVVPAPGDARWTQALVQRVGDLRASGHHVAVIAVPNFLWIDGSGPVDLELIGKVCHIPDRNHANSGGSLEVEGKAVFVVDATQSLGVVPIEVSTCQIDFLACSVHKWLFGPYGLSCLYVAQAWCDIAGCEPLVQDEHSRAGADGDGVLPFDLGRPGYPEEFQPGARRLDAGGRPNPILLPMVEAAFHQVLAWSPERVSATLAPMTRLIAEGARQLGFTVPACHAPHIVGVGPGLADVGPTADVVAAERWADDAAKFLKQRQIHVSARAGVLRVAPHLYNTADDMVIFLDALRDFRRTRQSHASAL